MRLADMKLLQRYARLQFDIAVAKNPTAIMDLTYETVTKSVGYKKLRAWFMRMSPRKRDDARRWLAQQCEGIEKIKKLAAQTGEDATSILADIEIKHLDDMGNEIEPVQLPDARETAAAQADVMSPEEMEHARHSADVSKESLMRALEEGRNAIANTGKEPPK